MSKTLYPYLTATLGDAALHLPLELAQPLEAAFAAANDAPAPINLPACLRRIQAGDAADGQPWQGSSSTPGQAVAAARRDRAAVGLVRSRGWGREGRYRRRCARRVDAGLPGAGGVCGVAGGCGSVVRTIEPLSTHLHNLARPALRSTRLAAGMSTPIPNPRPVLIEMQLDELDSRGGVVAEMIASTAPVMALSICPERMWYGFVLNDRDITRIRPGTRTHCTISFINHDGAKEAFP